MRTSKVTDMLAVLNWTPDQCRTYLESMRWPDGTQCPKCGELEPYRITRRSKSKNRVSRLLKCRACRRQFSATTGTIFEGSHIPLSKWLAALSFMCESNKGVSANILHRALGISYKSATNMMQRVGSAMEETERSELASVALAGVRKLDADVFPGVSESRKWIQNPLISGLVDGTIARRRVPSHN